jgi:hypothetical protein
MSLGIGLTENSVLESTSEVITTLSFLLDPARNPLSHPSPAAAARTNSAFE